MTARAESDYQTFSITSVASCATLYFKTEPAALDNFVDELKAMHSKGSDEANLWIH